MLLVEAHHILQVLPQEPAPAQGGSAGLGGGGANALVLALVLALEAAAEVETAQLVGIRVGGGPGVLVVLLVVLLAPHLLDAPDLLAAQLVEIRRGGGGLIGPRLGVFLVVFDARRLDHLAPLLPEALDLRAPPVVPRGLLTLLAVPLVELLALEQLGLAGLPLLRLDLLLPLLAGRPPLLQGLPFAAPAGPAPLALLIHAHLYLLVPLDTLEAALVVVVVVAAALLLLLGVLLGPVADGLLHPIELPDWEHRLLLLLPHHRLCLDNRLIAQTGAVVVRALALLGLHGLHPVRGAEVHNFLHTHPAALCGVPAQLLEPLLRLTHRCHQVILAPLFLQPRDGVGLPPTRAVVLRQACGRSLHELLPRAGELLGRRIEGHLGEILPAALLVHLCHAQARDPRLDTLEPLLDGDLQVRVAAGPGGALPLPRDHRLGLGLLRLLGVWVVSVGACVGAGPSVAVLLLLPLAGLFHFIVIPTALAAAVLLLLLSSSGVTFLASLHALMKRARGGSVLLLVLVVIEPKLLLVLAARAKEPSQEPAQVPSTSVLLPPCRLDLLLPPSHQLVGVLNPLRQELRAEALWEASSVAHSADKLSQVRVEAAAASKGAPGLLGGAGPCGARAGICSTRQPHGSKQQQQQGCCLSPEGSHSHQH
mmetsp:Transcript_33081/g.105415  ORF Transcript_33081/g.105415 Transcript_33081/m.105415 type:complete len:650 (-) Transcript_33081:226-2175(-)